LGNQKRIGVLFERTALERAMPDKPKKPEVINKAVKTEMDRRLERVREYLMTIEDLTPLADFEYRMLINKMTEKK
jgi:hypothetical protein